MCFLICWREKRADMERFTERELCDGKVCFTKCAQTNCPDKCAYCDIPKEAEKKLKEYEDLEEKELLLRLPCKVGDTVYVVPSRENYGINIINNHQENNRIYYQKVCRIGIYGVGTYSLITCEGMGIVTSYSFGETWFLKEDEAKYKLKELEDYWSKVFVETKKH